jgi:ABC-type branched-subunit amino acid transport system substrate-binding protein
MAACGTTTPVVSTVTGGQELGANGTIALGSSQPGAVNGVDTAHAVNGTVARGTSATGSDDTTVGRAPGTGGAPATSPGTGSAPARSAGPKTPVEIGIELLDMGEGLQLAGSAGNCNSDCYQSFSYSQADMVNAAVRWANANGGIAGRQIKLVTYTAKFADFIARGDATVQEEACQFWTKDHHVSALMLPNVVNADLLNCAVQHQLPIINGDYAQYVPDRQDLRGNARYDYASANFNADDAAKNYVNALVDQGFLKPTNTIGLIFKDEPAYKRAIKNTLEPELARHGLKIAATAPWTDGTAGDTNTWTQYAVGFNSKHVDRVLTYGGWSFGTAGFAKAADNQKYYPRYGVSSLVGPADMRIQGVPKSQLHGAVGVGWWTFADIMYSGDAASFNPAAALCAKIIRGAGQPWTPYTYRNAMKFCDNVFLLKTLADRAGEVSQPGFYAAADTLGSSFTSPYMWKTTFHPGDHHGATYLRNLAFDDACDCFNYVGKMYLPHW